jgi:hypothetical protein
MKCLKNLNNYTKKLHGNARRRNEVETLKNRVKERNMISKKLA